MYAAVIELDPLADTVRPAAKHHDFLSVTRHGLALIFISRVHIGGARRKFGRAGIDALIDRTDAQQVAARPHLSFARMQQTRQAAVGKPFALELTQRRGIDVVELHVVKQHLHAHDILNLRQEPRIDMRELVHFIKGKAVFKGIAHVPDALRPRLAQLFLQFLAVGRMLVHAIDADLQSAQGFLEGFLERAANGHDFADGLHLRTQTRIGRREFLESKTRHLDDDIVDRRLKRGRRLAAGDFIGQFVERITDCQLGRYFGDGESGRLGGQR